MKIIEENLLKKMITQLNNYEKEYQDVKERFTHLEEIEFTSLQELSFEKDNEFFDEVTFILSVITSIIAHPQISNRDEDIIERAEQVGNITNEALKQTIRDASLWKEKDFELVPEYIHYHQHIDDLKIYENIFIGMLIHLIDTELTKYDVFYQRLIPSMQTDALFIEESEKNEKTLTKIDSLKRKMLHIKNTAFYKEISKVNLNLRKIQPTNILLKNKLYNLCYKFYRKFVIYEDNKNLQIDFKKYYYYQILRVFKLNEFKLDDKNQSLVFNYQDKKIKLVDNEENSKISLEIKYHNNVYKHLLILSTDRELIDEYVEDKDYITTEVISLWNLYNVDTNEFVFNNQASEIEIARKWVMSKLQEVVAKKMIYSKYCPICKDKNLTIENDIYHCNNCKSIYTFKKETKDVIWFIKLRR